MHLLVHSFNKYALISHYMPGPFLGARDFGEQNR